MHVRPRLPGTFWCGSALCSYTGQLHIMMNLLTVTIIGVPFFAWALWTAYSIGRQVERVVSAYERDNANAPLVLDFRRGARE